MGDKNARYEATNRIVKQAVKGNKKAFTQLCEQEGKRVVYFCTKIMGNPHDGEDAAQEVFIRMQQGIRSLKNPESFTVWLQKIVFTVCIGLIQKEKRSGKIMPIEDFLEQIPQDNLSLLPQEYVENDEKRQQLMKIVDSLPLGMRSCIYLYYFEEISQQEIAGILGISEQTVNNQLYRARLKIRAEIQKFSPGAFVNGLVPMSAIGTIMRRQADLSVSVEAVTSCINAASLTGTSAVAGTAAVAAPIPGITAVIGIGLTAIAATGFLYLASNSPPVPLPVADVPQHSIQRPVREDGFEDMAAIPPDASAATASLPVSSPKIPAGGALSVVSALPEEAGVISDYTASASLAENTKPKPEPVSTPSASTAALLPQKYPGKVAGKVVLLQSGVKNKAVQLPAEHAKQVFRELQAVLYAPDSSLAGKAILSENGEFEIDIPGSCPAGKYQVILNLPENSPLVAAEDMDSNTIQFQVEASSAQYAVTFYLRALLPDYSIRMQSNDCRCGHLNPTQIEVVFHNALFGKVEWKLEEKQTGKSVRSGSGSLLETGQLSHSDLADGWYTLRFYITDDAGNNIQDELGLLMLSRHIDPGEFE